MCISKNLLKVLACALIVVACTQDDPATEDTEARKGPPRVYTVNYPLAYFAERIAGDAIQVIFPAPPDIDPAIWSPAAEIIADYQRADLVLLNGAGYADWIQRATLSQTRLVDTSATFTDSLISVVNGVVHSHGPDGDHSHQGTAFTTWLDMELAIGQANAVFDALVRLRPESESDFREGLNGLEMDLGELHIRLKNVAARIGDRPLVFSHPVYQYLSRAYGLNGRSVHWEPDEFPGNDQWRELSETLAGHAATWMIWEEEPLAETENRLEAIGVRSIVVRPCSNRPAEGSLVSVMLDNISALERAFPATTLPSDTE
jgi:zinc transport system substrate-binding protein